MRPQLRPFGRVEGHVGPSPFDWPKVRLTPAGPDANTPVFNARVCHFRRGLAKPVFSRFATGGQQHEQTAMSYQRFACSGRQPSAWLACAALMLVWTASVGGQTPAALPPPLGTTSSGSTPLSSVGLAPAGTPTGARGPVANQTPERISRLQRTIQSDISRLDELKCQLDDPANDYFRAEARFNALDAQRGDSRKAAQQALADGDQASLVRLQNELAELETTWSLAKLEFQLAIDQRKAQQASIATLQTKIEKDRQALEQLRGNGTMPLSAQATAQTPAVDPGAPAGQSAAPSEAAPPAANSSTAAPLAAGLMPAALPAAAGGELPPASDSGAVGGAAASPAGGKSSAGNGKAKPDQLVLQAEQAAANSEAVARQAEEQAASVGQRLEILRQDIALERELRSVAAGQIAVARDQLATFNGQLEQKLAAGEDVTAVRQQIRQAENAVLAAQADSERIAEHLDELQTELAALQGEQVTALQEAEVRRDEAEAAQRTLDALNSPFSARNVLAWLADHGVAIVLTLVALIVVLWAAGLLENRVVSLIALRSSRGSKEERENRAKTLISVLHNTLRTVAIAAAAIMILDECGVPVGPILGGAAVVGLAVAFGAQSLIKDYFTGFMVLMEQQYMIGDVIKIGDVTAQVERITLRMTVLRDLEGKVHFIPHGQITIVTNLTHEWSRAVLEIHVAYKEDADRVIDVLLELARALRKDPSFSYMLLDDPVMLGVDALGDSAVVIKFMIKTRPLKQWDVKRELLRRIKRRFDELSIEIPFPHRTLYLGNPPAAWNGAGRSLEAARPDSAS